MLKIKKYTSSDIEEKVYEVSLKHSSLSNRKIAVCVNNVVFAYIHEQDDLIRLIHEGGVEQNYCSIAKKYLDNDNN